jgi:dihydroxyacid dehydratase/phosphogluconate dehydratase
MTLISVLDLGKTVKAAVQKQGMIGWQFNTVGVSDAITMGGDGKSLLHRKRLSED